MSSRGELVFTEEDFQDVEFIVREINRFSPLLEVFEGVKSGEIDKFELMYHLPTSEKGREAICGRLAIAKIRDIARRHVDTLPNAPDWAIEPLTKILVNTLHGVLEGLTPDSHERDLTRWLSLSLKSCERQH